MSYLWVYDRLIKMLSMILCSLQVLETDAEVLRQEVHRDHATDFHTTQK